ncbi:hypothetical protein ABZP36_007101 [Zizania latifolia]
MVAVSMASRMPVPGAASSCASSSPALLSRQWDWNNPSQFLMGVVWLWSEYVGNYWPLASVGKHAGVGKRIENSRKDEQGGNDYEIFESDRTVRHTDLLFQLPPPPQQQSAPKADVVAAPAMNAIVGGAIESVPQEHEALLLPQQHVTESAPHPQEVDRNEEEVYNPSNNSERVVVEEAHISEVIDEVPNNVRVATLSPSAPMVTQGIERIRCTMTSDLLGSCIAKCIVNDWMVLGGSTAAKARLVPTSRRFAGNIVLGDITVAVDGKPIKGTSDLLRVLDDYGVGDKVSLTIRRGAETLEASV